MAVFCDRCINFADYGHLLRDPTIELQSQNDAIHKSLDYQLGPRRQRSKDIIAGCKN